MSRLPVNVSASARARQNRRAIEIQQKVGPDMWIAVGTFPTDAGTRFESPEWMNSYTFTAGRRVRFRHGVDGQLEMEGQFDLTDGAVSGDVAFILPVEYREFSEAFIPLELDVGVWSAAVITINGDDGEVILYWPIVGDPIP